MAELRSVDPRLLTLNPNNPRTSPVPKEMDQQLVASIKAIGLLQPPLAREIDGALVIRAGDRRTKAAIAAGKELIDVYVLDGNEDIDAMAAMSENLVRVGMNPVDTWRGIDKLEQQGWNEDAIANALALPKRAVLKLKLLGSLHPPMLDFMAKGSMPGEEQLRTIANAPLDDQAQVWKAHKPKKGHDVSLVGGRTGAEQAAHSVLGRQVRCRPGRGIRRDLVGGPVRTGGRRQPLHHQR